MALPIRIEYLSTAQKDREDIFNYIAKDNREAALKLLEEIDDAINQLKLNPLLGTIPNVTTLVKLGYRVLNVKNYVVLYTMKENIVQIRNIIHGWLKKQKFR